MITYHYIPKGSRHIANLYENRFNVDGQIIEYDWQCDFYLKMLAFLKIYIRIFLKRNCVHYFHFFPYKWLFPLLVLINRRVIVHIWGSEIYNTILPVSFIENHCLRRDSMLKNNLENHYKIEKFSYKQKLKFWLFLCTIGRSKAVVCSNFKYRYLSRQYFKTFKKLLKAEYLDIERYGVGKLLQRTYEIKENKKLDIHKLRVLVCHSATEDLDMQHVLLILDELKKNYSIEVIGFLSYSGYSEKHRDEIESRYQALFSSVSSNIKFYRSILAHGELDSILSEIDVSIIPAFRDEGVGLLSRLVSLGGIVCGAKSSINYKYFSEVCGNKVITPGELLAVKPQELRNIRSETPKLAFCTKRYDSNAVRN